ncbi:TVP38/TMEM64 family protein [Falsihalocynthiibacter sp. S25ZX9]|uniref:TVP38/TMEM64 family protein n=1 Tax=Falsihalocynthiibacter sp. S25ZX9 TaxID=3240870 RepID=UPI00350FD37B
MLSFKTLKTKHLAVAIFTVLVLVAVLLWFFGMPAMFDAEKTTAWIENLGVLGPLAIIALMTLAVVASPIPSAPIAVAAGAAYGKMAGMIYVAIGAETGAVLAFLIARYLGQEAVERFLGEKAGRGLLGSQNALTFAVFFSRLLPFVSFDIMSYAAGLSRLHLWRFLLATFAGILPASFALVFIGAKAMEGNSKWIMGVILGLGLLTSVPLLLMFFRRRTALEDSDDSDE